MGVEIETIKPGDGKKLIWRLIIILLHEWFDNFLVVVQLFFHLILNLFCIFYLLINNNNIIIYINVYIYILFIN